MGITTSVRVIEHARAAAASEPFTDLTAVRPGRVVGFGRTAVLDCRRGKTAPGARRIR
jgi:hypothetical protein